MKYLRISSALAVLLFFLPLLAMASEQHKSVRLDLKSTIANQQLKPGQYTLKWDDSKDNTNVDIQQNGKTVATVPAHIVRKQNPDNATFEANTANGQNKIDRVYTSNEVLVFGNNAAGE